MPSADSICFCESLTTASYSETCSLVKLQKTFISIFSGKSAMIDLSVLSRRRMNGDVSRLSRAAASGSLPA